MLCKQRLTIYIIHLQFISQVDEISEEQLILKMKKQNATDDNEKYILRFVNLQL